MRIFVVLAAMLQVAFGDSVVSMPYPNPAGVTYVGYSGHHAPLSYAAAAPLAQAPVPLQYGAHLQYQTHAAIPAQIETRHVGYASAQVPAVAAVPFVKHIPTVSQVPVTRYEAHHAVIEKQVDVIKPAVSTRKIEVIFRASIFKVVKLIINILQLFTLTLLKSCPITDDIDDEFDYPFFSNSIGASPSYSEAVLRH